MSIDKGSTTHNESTERVKKNWLSRFYLRRNTEKQAMYKPQSSMHYCHKSKPKAEKKTTKEVSGIIKNFVPIPHASTKKLDPVHERVSEHRQTIKNIGSEITSTESTPRIDEEEIIIHTLEGGYSEAIKKSFHEKYLFSKHVNSKMNKL